MFIKIVCAGRLIYRCSTMQILDDKPTKLFLLPGDNADTAFFVIIKNKMIKNYSVKISAKNTQNHRLFVVGKRR